MSKRRVTLSLDEDVVEALESQGARSLSAAANRALRQAVAVDAHRRSLLDWLDELDARHGRPTSEQLAAAEALLDDADAASGGEPDVA